MKLISSMKGFKGTDKDMKCRDFQFKLGEWVELPVGTELKTCEKGFHFCTQLAGVFNYYNDMTSRWFEIEAEDVLDVPFEPGSDFKRVCRKIRLVQEIKYDLEKGNNTGHRNTGHSNTGDRNTGHSNTGHRNTGDSNTGHRNTGHSNTGDRNTGDSNTGDGNTGYWNTGDSNTGDGNTGDGNGCNNSSGFFCTKESSVVCFDVKTKLSKKDFMDKYPEYGNLCRDLVQDKDIDFNFYKNIPGITKSKLKKLHGIFKKAGGET